MSFLYWIRLPEHSDITSQGYVGITSKTVAYRFDKHRRHSNNPKTKKYTIHNAFLKYQDKILVDTILEGSQEYCLLMEQRLRPAPSIGWNQSQGGAKTRLGISCSEETKLKISASKVGKKMDQAHRVRLTAAITGIPRSTECKNKISLAHKKIPTWSHGAADSATWVSAIHLHNIYKENPSFGTRSLGKIVDIPEGRLVSILNKFRNGWNPNEDQEYLSWLKERKSNES